MSTVRGNLFYFGLGIFGLGMNIAFLMIPVIPFWLRTIFVGCMLVYGLLIWTTYRDLIELYQEQAGSESSSSSDREVIEVIIQ